MLKPARLLHFLAKLTRKIVKHRNATLNAIGHVTKPKLMEVLGEDKDLSIMHDLMNRSPIMNIISASHPIRKVCFENNLCVRVTGDVRKHFQNLCRAKKFTIHAMDNDYFRKMTNNSLIRLQTDKKVRDMFLLKHIYLGTLRHQERQNDDDSNRLIGVPLQKMQPVSEWLWSDGKQIISKPDEPAFVVEREIRVREGLLQVLKTAIQEN